MFTNPSTAKPGADVTAQGYYFAKTHDVEARLDSIDGRVLARFTLRSGSKGLEFQGPVPVPTDARPGVHVLIFTQFDPSGKIVQMPPRALLTVTDPNGAAPVLGAPLATDPTPRPPAIARSDDDAFGLGELALIGTGAAGIAMLAVGAAAMATGRRSKTGRVAVTS